MRIVRVALLCAVVVAAGVLLVSGGSDAGPQTPPALPGLPPPFLGTAVTGDGGLTAAIDAYGDVVDLRAGPAGGALIDNPSDRQAAGTVPEDTGIVPRVDGEAMWEADAVTQRYLPGTNVVRTVARFGERRVVMTTAASGQSLAVSIGSRPKADLSLDVNVDGIRCARDRRAGLLDLVCGSGRAVPPAPAAAARETIASATTAARHWLAGSRSLGSASHGTPRWASAMYERSLLTIHALTSRRTGAVAAGARDGWAYVWPRDAATAALALEASGHRAEARKVAQFLTGLDLSAAARFTESGAPVSDRAAQGDAFGWTTVAAKATGIKPPRGPYEWQDRADYQESSPGNYLGNALAAASSDVDGPKSPDILDFSAHQHGGLFRAEGEAGSGLDSAAGWAVRPFGLRVLFPAAERTLLSLAAQGTRYGITPGEGWEGGDDPWTAPTAWSAWALAGLGDRKAALSLLGDLRRATTPAGDLPERIGLHTGIPTSTTPLLWSSAFAVLALREIWP
ncbi:MAG: hypothetical protein JST59_27150 [Actinobacteria bacterium]|nr:hypothetical protein [Actinomycetota bacterium]